METAVADLKASLIARFENAVLSGMREIAKVEGKKIAVEEQERYTERLCACHVTLMGQNWLGNLTLMVPMVGTQAIAMDLKSIKPGEKVHGADMAEVLGNVTAAVALRFGQSFLDEEALTISMPTIAIGTDLAIVFPWGKNFESRLCFKGEKTSFWAILRLSLHAEGDDTPAPSRGRG